MRGFADSTITGDCVIADVCGQRRDIRDRKLTNIVADKMLLPFSFFFFFLIYIFRRVETKIKKNRNTFL